MNEASLRSILGRLGITPGRANHNGWMDFPCPISRWTHAKGYDRSPSAGAKINREGPSSWVCHTCKGHGRISGLIYEIERYSGVLHPGLIREADEADVMEGFEADFGTFEIRNNPPPEPLVEEAYIGLYEQASRNPESILYLMGRSITQATADHLGLLYDEGQRRILFPVRDRDGALFGYSGRALDADTKPRIKDYFGLPKRSLILGAHLWSQDKPLILVEGLFGYAHLHEIGVANFANIGALLGSVLTPEKAAIVRLFDQPTYLMFDNDEAGEVGLFGRILPSGEADTTLSAIEQLKNDVPLFVPAWPEGKMDPDELTLDDVTAILDSAPLWQTT